MSASFSSFSFSSKWEDKYSLKDINLKIDKGEVVAILGDRSSGNQNLLMAMNGLIPHEIPGKVEGDVIVNGLNTRDHSVAELSQNVGLLLEDPSNQLVFLTVESDIAFGPSNLALPVEEIENRVNYALKATRLERHRKRNPSTLSGGQQQCCALAGLLAMRPGIVAMIDPVSMLDPLGKAQIYSTVKLLNEEYGLTIVISESGMNIESICEIATRIIVMREGRIVLDGSPSKVFEDESVHRLGIPQVTDLFFRLREKRPDLPLPITVAGAAKCLRKLLKGKNIQLTGRQVPVTREKKVIIKIRNLHHMYPSTPPVHALQGLNLDIHESEFLGIIGQNGGGKTTLAYHLVGLLKPTNKDAEILVDGVNVLKTPLKEVIKHINYTFQNPENQFFRDTVKQEMSFGLEQQGIPKDEIERLTSVNLENFGIEKYLDEYVTYLPRDIKTYVAEASIAAMNPKIMVIDEPTGGLDAEGASKMMKSLVKLNKEGKTIIIITHDMKVIADYASRIVAIADGRILLDGPTNEVFSKKDKLAEARLEPPKITQLGQELKDIGFPPDTTSINEVYALISGVL